MAGTREAFIFLYSGGGPGRPQRQNFNAQPFLSNLRRRRAFGGLPAGVLNCTKRAILPDFDAVAAIPGAIARCYLSARPATPPAKLFPATLQKLIVWPMNTILLSPRTSVTRTVLRAKPPGLLEACASLGPHRIIAAAWYFTASKRSNLPGLRSGFIAGDAAILQQYLLYRTYLLRLPSSHPISQPISLAG